VDRSPASSLSLFAQDSRSRDLIGRVRAFCRREGLFPSDGGALVLVSGGADSMALLHLLASGALGTDGPARARALHINHALRGEESVADELLVRTSCARWGVPLVVRRAPVAKGAGNLQERARDLRRRAAATEAHSGECIAVGHTRDDQVETMLYRMGRYGGLRALRAMVPRRGGVVRPLLVVGRAETAAYCARAGIGFADDCGNRDPAYARTGLRERGLPLLEELLPGFQAAAARTADAAGEALSALDTLLAEAREALTPGAASPRTLAQAPWSVERFWTLAPALRRLLIWELCEELTGVVPSRGLVLEIERALALPGSVRVPLGGGLWLDKRYGCASVTTDAGRRGPAGERAPVNLEVPGTVAWGRVTVSAEPTDVFRAPDPRWEAYVDARSIVAPLLVRGVLPGDHLRPLGAPGRRSVQDLLVDRLVPALLRAEVPLILSRGEVVWVGGIAVADQSKLQRDSVRLVRLRIGSGECGESA
jgi:tRNA(Ile)-lysidine synthase